LAGLQVIDPDANQSRADQNRADNVREFKEIVDHDGLFCGISLFT
jgi:hypothetical protein